MSAQGKNTRERGLLMHQHLKEKLKTQVETGEVEEEKET
jgi:hypothetical protein